MNDCLLIRSLILGMLLFPVITNGQDGYSSAGVFSRATSYNPEGAIVSNVPLNEINIHAFRHFHRRWPVVSGESWIKSEDGYVVSFTEGSLHHQAHFDRRGGYLYSLKYYSGKEISRNLEGIIRKKYGDYTVDVVTEITDGEKTFYLIKIENSSSVKTLSVCDGKIEVLEELVNGGIGSR
jgi:hypothetical protein